MSRKQFAVYMAVSVTGFTLIGLILKEHNVGALWAFATGFLYSIPVEELRDLFQENR